MVVEAPTTAPKWAPAPKAWPVRARRPTALLQMQGVKNKSACGYEETNKALLQ
jgi:hypothetical protein